MVTLARLPSRGADHVQEYRHRVHEAIAIVSGQWVYAILATLLARPMRYQELLQEINTAEERLGWAGHDRPLSQKVLTQTLHRMRRDGLVDRVAGAARVTAPVVYQITPMGRALLRALRPLGEWLRDYEGDLATARTRARDDGDPP